jgi:hypothetical protein
MITDTLREDEHVFVQASPAWQATCPIHLQRGKPHVLFIGTEDLKPTLRRRIKPVTPLDPFVLEMFNEK